MVEFTYTLSEDDFASAGGLMLRKRSPVLRILQWIGGVSLVLVSSSLVVNSDLRETAFNLPGMFAGLFFPVFFLILPYISQRSLRKQYRKVPILGETRTAIFSESGLDFSSASAQTHLAWDVFVAFFEDKTNFVLVQQGKQVFVPLPKSEMQLWQVDELRSLFETRIGRK